MTGAYGAGMGSPMTGAYGAGIAIRGWADEIAAEAAALPPDAELPPHYAVVRSQVFKMSIDFNFDRFLVGLSIFFIFFKFAEAAALPPDAEFPPHYAVVRSQVIPIDYY